MKNVVFALTLAVLSCTGSKDEPTTGVDGDADTDADADSDADTDTTPPVDADGDGSPAGVDCNDADADIYPGAPDVCGDDAVTDCNRTSDDGLVTLDGNQGFDDLALALAAAVSGSEILICEGTHTGTFTATVAVRLVGYGSPDDTVLDGAGAGTTLSLPGGSEIRGLTISGGRTNQSGGGVRQTTPGTLVIQDSRIARNRARFGGGLAVPAGGQVVFVNTEVDDNIADQSGGGVYAQAGGTLDLTAGGSVTANTASLAGGGVLLEEASIEGGIVSDNVLTEVQYFYFDYYNGGFYTNGPAGGGGIATIGTASIRGVDVFNNEGPGGGVSVVEGSAVVADTLIHNNATPPGLFAGGLLVAAADVDLTGSQIYDNRAGQGGGGIVVDGAVTGGVFRTNVADELGGGLAVIITELNGTTLTDNTAPIGGGVWYLGPVVADGLLVTGNSADRGGAFAADIQYYLPFGDTVMTLTNSEVTGNSAGEGGGFLVAYPIVMTDTLVADNTAVFGGGLLIESGMVEVTGGAIVRNTASTRGGGAIVRGTGALLTTVTDLGVGADENTPEDIFAGASYGYGTESSVVCVPTGCTP